MKFTLTYSGELRANANPRHKHEIRTAFHFQLKTLWTLPPLSNWTEWHDDDDPSARIQLRRMNGEFRLVPLVSSKLHLVCDLRIFMLRPELPGSIIVQGGDIDNRLKTLFDALRIPGPGELPEGALPGEDQYPFFCLLEDDSLITSVSVKADRLLKSPASAAEVHLDIQVTTIPTQTIENGQLTGGFFIN